jgi:phage gp29-like protein
MEAFGGFNYLVHPDGTTITFHKTESAAGSNTVYKDLKDSCNAEISKVFLGNTMTTEQGENGARSLGDVHLEVEEQKYKADARFVLSVLNTQFRSILKRFGFDITGWEIWFETPGTDWEYVQKKYNVINGIADRVPVSDDFWYEEFDIPRPDNYEELKEEMLAAKSINPLTQLQNPLADEAPSEQKTEQKKAQNLLGRVLGFFA